MKPVRPKIQIGMESAKMSADGVRVVKLLVRCVAERVAKDQWQAFSLEFGLAAQGSTSREAQNKLESMVESYVREALTEDRDHAEYLLNRKSGWSVYLKYYRARIASSLQFNVRGSHGGFSYQRPLPLEPKHA